MSKVLLHGARLVLPQGETAVGSILIEGETIKEISSGGSSIGHDGKQIDLSGLTLFSGFIDIHIHGAVGVDTMAASTDDLNRASRFLATQGVTAWLPTLVPAATENYQRAIAAIAGTIQTPSEETNGARVIGVHYEGPFVNTLQCGALHADFFRSFTGADELDDLPRLESQNAKHMMTLAPEIAGGVELVRELRKRNWIVSLGHTRAGFAVLDEALSAGASHMTHFMNAMAPLHHRAPGPVAWGLSRDEVTCDFIADGVHLDRDVLRLLLKLKGTDRLSLISDAIAAAGQGDGDYDIWGETITVKDRRTSNARGSIAGSVITLLDAVRLMLSLGVSEGDVARMASHNPARLLGIDKQYGSIEEGKRADLVAIDRDGNVRLTMVGGQQQTES